MKPMEGKEKRLPAGRSKRVPQNHRTVDRVTRILEEVVYHPGITFAELVCALNAAKSSVHGFMRGLLAKGWLYEEQGRYYLGPAVDGLPRQWSHPGGTGDACRPGRAARGDGRGGVPRGAGRRHLMYIAEAGSGAIRVRSAVEHPPPDAGHGGGRRCSRRGQTASVCRICADIAPRKPIWLTSSSRSTRRSNGPGSRRTFAAGARDSVSPQPSTIRPARPWRPSRSSASPLSAAPRAGVGGTAAAAVDSWPQRSMTPREAI